MNADDDMDTNGNGVDGDNYGPDPVNIDIQDRAFGGAGRDVLIANTGGDRLIDWIGEFDSFIVPFAPFGEFTVTRAVPPGMFDFLYDLSEAVGADQTRAADTGNDAARNGEPDGELGLVTQKDGQLWKDQTGAPIDPQPGNIPGGERLTLRGVDFNDGTAQAFTADAGVWQVKQGRFEVSPEVAGGDATAVFHIGEYLPNYYEVQATISTAKPVGGAKANTYLLFDYVSPTDFKFAGANVSTDKLELGYVDENGWHVVVQTPAKLKPNTDYQVLLAVNGLTATVVVDNQDSSTMTHVFAARVDDGYSYGLNYGLVGLGAQNATARIDNMLVQILKPEVTFEDSNDFSDTDNGFMPLVGEWDVANDRYVGTPGNNSVDALSAYDLAIGPNSNLEMSSVFSTDGLGGFFFDYYGEHEYKFAGVLGATDQVVIGHWNAKSGALIYDVTADVGYETQGEYDLRVTLNGSVVTVALGAVDAQGNVIYHDILAHVFNAVVVDGQFGLLSMNGATSFDSFAMNTDDDAFLAPSDPLLAPSEGQGDDYVLQLDDIDPILEAAKQNLISGLRLSEEDQAKLAGVTINVADLSGLTLARSNGSSLELDIDAAGNGWYVDRTPYTDEEFIYQPGEADLTAKPHSDAYGRIDLLTVITHELGHLLGFDHGSYPFMSETLQVGMRVDVIETDIFGQVLGASQPTGLEDLPAAPVIAAPNRDNASALGVVKYFDEDDGQFVQKEANVPSFVGIVDDYVFFTDKDKGKGDEVKSFIYAGFDDSLIKSKQSKLNQGVSWLKKLMNK